MVFDMDFMRFVQHGGICVKFEAGMLIEWLICEANRVIISRLDQMPGKDKKVNQPHVIWLGLPLHKCFGEQENELRIKYNKCLQSMIPLYKI